MNPARLAWYGGRLRRKSGRPDVALSTWSLLKMALDRDDGEHGVDDECPGCGSSPADRRDYAARHGDPRIPLGLQNCPHCGTGKCCMCDLGDDVECVSCGAGDEA